MDIVEIIAERKIKEAMERGEFENLQGTGKPLEPDGLDAVPEDLRAAVKILRNAGYLSDETELRHEIYSLRKLVCICENQIEKDGIEKRLTAAELKLSMILEKRKSEIPYEYRDSLRHKMST